MEASTFVEAMKFGAISIFSNTGTAWVVTISGHDEILSLFCVILIICFLLELKILVSSLDTIDFLDEIYGVMPYYLKRKWPPMSGILVLLVVSSMLSWSLLPCASLVCHCSCSMTLFKASCLFLPINPLIEPFLRHILSIFSMQHLFICFFNICTSSNLFSSFHILSPLV